MRIQEILKKFLPLRDMGN